MYEPSREMLDRMRTGKIKFELLEDNGTVSQVVYNGYDTQVNTNGNVVILVKLARDD